ncbi:hypothetical protein HOLleu_18834 [Holothuria leucospilota]|uniref:Uncharacterized protein n=1 Tax=Holothuria leucospilota TaxID=206669 RepID=A0A9Q1C4S1_HOLLE|nr:hypothetical protein HOLleu_18834 [Holothuria leucospilota]
MLPKLQKYQLPVSYKKGSELQVVKVMERVVYPLPISRERLKQIERETQKDEILSKLYSQIVDGWPASKQKLDKELAPYWSCQSELTVEKGIILKNARVVIPKTMRRLMLKRKYIKVIKELKKLGG